MPLIPDPHIAVSLWSRTPVRATHYLPVTVETLALLQARQVMMVLTRPDGLSMGLHLTEDGLKELSRQLAEITRRFRAHTKETS